MWHIKGWKLWLSWRVLSSLQGTPLRCSKSFSKSSFEFSFKFSCLNFLYDDHSNTGENLLPARRNHVGSPLQKLCQFREEWGIHLFFIILQVIWILWDIWCYSIGLVCCGPLPCVKRDCGHHPASFCRPTQNSGKRGKGRHPYRKTLLNGHRLVGLILFLPSNST